MHALIISNIEHNFFKPIVKTLFFDHIYLMYKQGYLEIFTFARTIATTRKSLFNYLPSFLTRTIFLVKIMDWLACSCVISGQILEAASSLLAFRKIRKRNFRSRLFKVFLSGGWSSLWDWLANFFTFCPGGVEAGKTLFFSQLMFSKNWLLSQFEGSLFEFCLFRRFVLI